MKKKRFLIYILLLFMLFLAAVFFPWLIFSIQDSLRLRSTQIQTRESVELEQLNIPYEMSVSKRLENFAGKPDGYFVTATEYAHSMEHYTMIEELLYGEYMARMMTYYSVLSDGIGGPYDISELKKYVIYNEELENGVAFIAWYAALVLSGGEKLELLWDAKTETVYCLRYQREAELLEKAENFAANEAIEETEHQSKSYQEHSETVELNHLADNWFRETEYFCSEYYENDFWNFLNRILENEQRYEASQRSSFGENQDTWELTLYDREKEEQISLVSWRYRSNGQLNFFRSEFAFPYGENFLEFVVRNKDAEYGEAVELLIGIKELGALIPEFEEIEER